MDLLDEDEKRRKFVSESIEIIKENFEGIINFIEELSKIPKNTDIDGNELELKKLREENLKLINENNGYKLKIIQMKENIDIESKTLSSVNVTEELQSEKEIFNNRCYELIELKDDFQTISNNYTKAFEKVRRNHYYRGEFL